MRRRDVTVTVTAVAISEKAVITVNQIFGPSAIALKCSLSHCCSSGDVLLGGADEPRWCDAADRTAAIR